MASIGGRYNPPPDHSSRGVVEEEGHCCRYMGGRLVCVVLAKDIHRAPLYRSMDRVEAAQ